MTRQFVRRAAIRVVGCLLVASAIAKALAPCAASRIIDEMVGYPAVFTGVLVFTEASLGALVLAKPASVPLTWATFALFLFFTGLVVYLQVVKNVDDCGCFGRFLDLPGWAATTRNVSVLVLLSWNLAAESRQAAGTRP